MGRPKIPLINRDDVVGKALELIDRDGLEAFSIRKLGSELGVNGASLYYHFEDKDAILHGVRLLVLQEGRVGGLPDGTETWQDYTRRSVVQFRRALLRHPNTAPLMAPTLLIRPFGLVLRDRVAAMLLESGLPAKFAYPLIDSTETLAFGSALLNPQQQSPSERLGLRPTDDVPTLAKTLRSAPKSPDKLFALQLEALIQGWTVLIEADRAST